MARRKVVTTTMFRYERDIHKNTGGGIFGRFATRKETTRATSDKLLRYRACIEGKMQGTADKLETLGDVQRAFAIAASLCSGKPIKEETRAKLGLTPEVEASLKSKLGWA